MRICTFDECAAWCAAHGYETRHIEGYIAGPSPELVEPDFHFAMFSIPADSGRRVALAKRLLSLFPDNVELFLQIGDWSAWESSQHMPLFARFREAFGERRPLIEAPGHIVRPTQRDDALSILVLSMLYLWNCHVLQPDGEQGIFVSHDEYGWVAARRSTSLDRAEQMLEAFGVLNAPRDEP